MELKTLKQPHRLELFLAAKGTKPIQVMGLDHYRPSTQYFKLILPAFKGNRHLSIPMGTTPLRMEIKTNARLMGLKLAANPISLSQKQQAAHLLPNGRTLKDYLDFITEFAAASNYLQKGVHTSQKGDFAILYDDKVRTVLTNQALFTPMRVNNITGDVEASKDYFQHPEIGVFVIIYQFLHELGHYDLATADEFEADRYGADLFMRLGYPAFSIIHLMDSMIYRYEKQYQTINQALYERRIALIRHLKNQRII